MDDGGKGQRGRKSEGRRRVRRSVSIASLSLPCHHPIYIYRTAQPTTNVTTAVMVASTIWMITRLSRMTAILMIKTMEVRRKKSMACLLRI